MIYLNGSSYEGGWLRDRQHGQATNYDTKAGEVYKGSYSEGRRDGHGRIYSQKKGEMFTGDFMSGKKHGSGTVLTSSGILKSVNYRQDMFDGQHTFERKVNSKHARRLLRDFTAKKDLQVMIL